MMEGREGFSLEDIRPDKLMQGLDEVPDIGRKREVLRSRSAEFVNVACPACAGASFQEEFVKGGFRYVSCRGCSLVFNNPRPGPELLAEYYADNPLYEYWNREIFRQTEDARLQKIVMPRVDRVLELCREYQISGGTLVEIGAGFGTFCGEIQSRGHFKQVVAVEPDTTLAETCCQRGLQTVNRPYEQAELQDASAAAVVSFEVIEHLFDPGDFIAFCRRLLAPGGMLVLSFPNYDGFDIAQLGPLSGSVGGEHINLFNRRSITALLERNGFKLVSCETPGYLDAELVRKAVLEGALDLQGQPFLQQVLVDQWETLGRPFQRFLRENGLSSHMLIAAIRQGQAP